MDATVTGLSRAAAAAVAEGRPSRPPSGWPKPSAWPRDDETLADRLAALPPPAPAAARAQPNGQQVLVSWEPSPAHASRMRYRVLRGLARAPVSATDGTPVVDRHREARSVADQDAAGRGGGVLQRFRRARRCRCTRRRPSTALLPFAPDVADVDVSGSGIHGHHLVAAPPPGRKPSTSSAGSTGPGQDATSRRCRGRHRRDRVDARLHRPRRCATGTQYRYRITAVYRAPDGARRLSGGIVVPAVPTPEPAAVTDLTWEVLSRGGRPVLRAGRAELDPTPARPGAAGPGRPRPRLAAGARITPDPDTLTDIPGQPEHDDDGRAVLRARLPFGRHFVTALTELGRVVVAGNTVPLMLLEPARDAHADRRHDTVELSWVWPRDATDVIVRHPAARLDCSRRAYFDEGGCTIRVDRARGHVQHHRRAPGPGRPPDRPTEPGCAGPASRVSLTHPQAAAASAAACDRGLRRGKRSAAAAGDRADYRPVPPTDPAEGERIQETGRHAARASRPVHRQPAPPGPRLGGLLR